MTRRGHIRFGSSAGRTFAGMITTFVLTTLVNGCRNGPFAHERCPGGGVPADRFAQVDTIADVAGRRVRLRIAASIDSSVPTLEEFHPALSLSYQLVADTGSTIPVGVSVSRMWVLCGTSAFEVHLPTPSLPVDGTGMPAATPTSGDALVENAWNRTDLDVVAEMREAGGRVDSVRGRANRPW